MATYKDITECRLCNSSDLNPVVSFKPQYIASTFVETNEGRDNPKIPMTLLLCDGCGLVQLKETVNPELLYKNYFYRSNVSDTMNRDLRDVVKDAMSRVKLKPKDAVLDIGCNDGLMLTFYPEWLEKVGIDPAENIDRSALTFDERTEIVQGYFPRDVPKKKYKIITSTAMFYDLDDPNKAVRAIRDLLSEDGVAVIQVSYLYDTIKDMNFYDICHEHLEYYSLKTLLELMNRNQMKIIDASVNAVNGGSLRVVIAHQESKYEISSNISYLALRELPLRLEQSLTYKVFGAMIESNAKKVSEFIRDQEGLVIGLGASTKGNVLLQICGIGKDTLPYISERSPHKWGLRTMGSDIELVSEEAARALKPACMFVIPWNFKKEIVHREQRYINEGGKLLFIMPHPYVIDRDGEHRL